MKNKSIFLVGLLGLLLLSGCAESVSFENAGTIEPVGFWFGLWHGMIFPLAWLVSLFSSDVAIYAIYNNGGWYDFGFFLGLSSICSSGSTAVKHGKD